MSDQFGNTQPNKPYELDDTQPIQRVKPSAPRWRSILLGALAFLLVIGLGAFGGYSAGISARRTAERAIMSEQLAEQFSFALVDIEFGHYENARQRLEYIIREDPSFPGAQEKLTEVMVLITTTGSTGDVAAPPTEAAVEATPVPDYTGADSALARAQELIRAQDWVGALSALDSVRKFDRTYQAAKVDGMYYFALRNYGFSLISQQGNLEGGIYHLTLAERFGPLDNSAKSLREGARLYITGASFWELNWGEAASYFEQVAAGWPSMWDGTMTASQRYFITLMRLGDQLFTRTDYCGAYEYYQLAASLGTLEAESARNSEQAYQACYPPTAIPEVVEPTATPSTEAPTEAPTAEPTPTP